MTLEDFERELAQSKEAERHHKRKRDRSRSPSHRDGHRRHKHHRSSRHHHDDRRHSAGEQRTSRHSHERSKHHGDSDEVQNKHATRKTPRLDESEDDDEDEEWVEKEAAAPPPADETLDARGEIESAAALKRDSWMEAPSALDIDYVQRDRRAKPPPSTYVKATTGDPVMKRHVNEVNYRLRDPEWEERGDEQTRQDDNKPSLPTQHEVAYTFGDTGSSWRMKKLQNTYREAEESGRPVEDVAVERFGDLRAFDDAREEETEMDRRQRYGRDYVGKEKPSGDLHQERKLDQGVHRHPPAPSGEESDDEFEAAQGETVRERDPPAQTLALDQTALNKLKAQMMRAKIAKASNAAELEVEYNEAMTASAANSKQSNVIVLNKMEARELAGGRQGEVKAVTNKRGQERGLVQENEDMSIDDMVRQERRTRLQPGGQSNQFAERIAKGARFTNDLDYMDDNAAALANSVQKSDVNLRNTAISGFQKMKKILDTCPLCHHEDSGRPPVAPLVSLATRTFLTLPTSPEITPYGLCASIVPIQHRTNLLGCDDDEWEEMRNFMKSLTRFYMALKPSRSIVFYENAAQEGRRRHASLEAVPLSAHLAEQAPAYFREAILSADEEWTQHKKIIDTMEKATRGGLGKMAFRRSMVSELPYFHVWFTLDGGLGHVVEDLMRWPKGDLFAREILGGMLDVGPEVIKRQGRWTKGDGGIERRVQDFRTKWGSWDWTRALVEGE